MKRLAATLALAAGLAVGGPAAAGEPGVFRVLHVMSYHSPMRWADGQFAGFQEALKGARVEYRVVRMDANRNRSPGWLRDQSAAARKLIDAWKPDLVYASDDDAQEHVTRHYVNTPLPIVVSGVNKDPAAYGFVGSRNVAGVLEPVHIVETIRLLHGIVPGAKRFAIVSDQSPSMLALGEQIRARITEIPGASVVAFAKVTTFAGYQSAVRDLQHSADALWPLGVHGLLDGRGRAVPRQEVLRWTAEHSRLPDLSFWEERVALGTLVAVTVSAREQGLAAGRMARAILLEGASPASFAFRPTAKGVPMVSLARAGKLGLKVVSGVLLSADVLQTFEWDAR